MQLKDYLHIKNITLTSFAQRLEISRQHLDKIVNRGLHPSKLLARYIEQITEGHVTVAELMGEKTDSEEMSNG